MCQIHWLIFISEGKQMDDFKELSGVTLNKIRSFGIKSKSVIKCFKRSCRLLETFLQENNLSFSAENALQWLSGFVILKKGNRSQRNQYLSHRRAILLLLEMSNNQLDEWKVYPLKTAQRPATEHYLNLLEQYKHYLLLEKMAEATITFSLRVVSMFFCYLESMNIDRIKQHLKFGKCQSQDFDAQISHVTTTYILYVFLAYFRRVNDYETLGGLFEHVKDEMIEKNLAERLWDMFEELLQVVITAIAESGTVDIKEFKNSPEYQFLRELFEDSFLGKQLFHEDKAA